MFRVPRRLAHALLSASLLTGCASGPVGLGAPMHRSIKDDPASSQVAAVPKIMPAQTQAKVAVLKPAPPPRPNTPKQDRSAEPTCASGSACMVRLKAMIENPNRDWVGRSQSPVEYANGTRLFAYRALRAQLTCPQLASALGEVGAAAKTFAAPVAGVSAQQAKRVLALNAEVQGELRAEFGGRCMKGSTVE
jgi:hypothetical protein